MAAIGAASSALPARARPKRRGSAPLHAVPATAPLPAGIVGRPAVVERLAAARAASLVLVVAPAGYGKTTVLREWDLTDSRQFAWWRLSAADDDPERFAESVTRARATLARNSEQVLILDDVHVLRRRETLELLGSLVDDLGEHGQLVLAGRARPGLPIARLRTERRLVEMNSPDLVLTRAESAAVASANGLELDEAGRELLAWRAEGWPAAVYLAAVALRDEPDTRAALAQFTGSDRLVSDYVRSELLAPLPRKLADFLQRASVLPRLSACACDYVLEREDSGRMLAELARTNVPLVPLDRSDTEYRLNRLFAEALQSDLQRRDSSAQAALHARASAWFEARGEHDAAIDQAFAAGDLERAGDLVWNEVPALVAYGRDESLANRIERFSSNDVASCAPLALSAASTAIAAGDAGGAERWIATALRVDPSRKVQLTAARSALAPASLQAMCDSARAARGRGADDSPWQSLGCFIEGVAAYLGGDELTAQRRLDEGARRGAAVAPLVQALCLAELAAAAIDDEEWATAETLAARARAQTERVMLADYPTSALIYAVSAAIAGHLGQVEACERDFHHGSRLLERLSGFSAWYTAQCRIALANAALRLSDLPRARRLVDEAAHELRLLPDAVTAHQALEACRAQCELLAASREAGSEALTAAELRVLQFLPTHLSFPEIADRLYVSRNTVKTHVRAVYRKLTASCRSEAVSRAREAGLLDPTA